MSKIGNKPITIPDGVGVTMESGYLRVKGPYATTEVSVPGGVSVEIKDGVIRFSAKSQTTQSRSDWGTLRSLVQSAITGSREKFVKTLVIEGIGYRASVSGKKLVLNLGFSHPVEFTSPENVEIEVDGNQIKVSGSNKSQVGEVSANIRKLKKPEPYKGKGIHYIDEIIRRKAGKKAVGSGT